MRLKALWKLAPKTAVVVRKGQELHCSYSSRSVKGETLVVRPGENIPVDGGSWKEPQQSMQSALRPAESIPADKETGDMVSAATVNQLIIKCEATRVGEDTTLSQIIKMVSDAQLLKAPIAKIADRVSGVFVLRQ